MVGENYRAEGAAGRCVVESLEDRRLMSAATVWASLRPTETWPADFAAAHVQHGHKVSATVKAALPDLTGTWSGTFTNNTTRAPVDATIQLNSRWKDTFTGMFNVASVAGSNVLSSVTVGKTRQFNVVLKLPNKSQLSVAAYVSSDYKTLVGRWSLQTPKGWKTGVLQMKRG